MKTLHCLVLVIFLVGISSGKILHENVKLKQNQVADPEVCQFCELAFAHIKNLFSAYESMLKSALLNFCKSTGSFSPECTSFVNHYYDKIFNYLINDFNSTKFCTFITLCPGYSEKFFKGEACSICNEIGTVLKYELNQTEVKAEVKTEITKLCNLAGSYSGICQSFIESYFDPAYSKFLQFLEGNDVCQETGICPETLSTKSITGAANGKGCTYCLQILGTLKFALTESKQALKSELLTLCAKAGSLSSECQVAVNLLYDKLFDRLLNLLNPYTICDDLHLCNISGINDDQLCSKLGFCSVAGTPNGVANKKFCGICTDSVMDIRTVLKSVQAQDVMKSYLLAGCNKLGKLSTVCKMNVKKYLPTAINVLLSYIDPLEICTQFELCTGNEVRKYGKIRYSSSEMCEMCSKGFFELKSELSKDTMKTFSRSEVLQLCNDAKSLNSTCQTLVKSYFYFLYSIAVEYLEPKIICQDLSLCNAKASLNSTQIMSKNAEHEFCPICTNGLKKMKLQLSSSKVRKDLKNGMFYLCDEFGSLSVECKSYTSAYFDLAYQLMLGYLQPKVMCTDLKFCKSSKNSSNYKALYHGDYCSVCLHAAVQMNYKTSRVVLKKKLEFEADRFCKYTNMKDIQLICQTLMRFAINVTSREVFSYLSYPKPACASIGFCNSSNAKIPKIETSGIVCDFCMANVKILISGFSTPKFKMWIKSELLKFCNVTGPFKAKCTGFFNSYLDVILNLLQYYVQPKPVCTLIRLCKTSVSKTNSIKDGEFCSICKAGIEELEVELSKDSVKAEIKKEVLSICPSLGDTLSKKCQTYVNAYFEMVYELALGYLTPTTVCGDIGICSSSLNRKLSASMPNALTISKLSQNTIECNLCKLGVKELKKELSSTAVENSIKSALIKLCHKINSSECESLVNQYFDVVIGVIFQFLNSTTICGDIGLCSSNANRISSVSVNRKEDSKVCSLCKTDFQKLKAELSKESVKTKVKTALLSLCSSLGGTRSKKCQTYVNDYFDIAYQLVLDYVDPETVCRDIRLCSSNFNRTSSSVNRIKDSKMCSMCKTELQELKTALSKDSVKTEIKTEVLSFCSSLGGKLSKKCQTYVNDYFDIVYQVTVEYLDPETFCRDIRLCSSNLNGISSPSYFKCVLCQIEVKDFKADLSISAIRNDIKSIFIKLCHEINSTKCGSFVNQYFDTVIKVAEQFMDPDTLCGELNFCKSAFQNASTSCKVCQIMAKGFTPQIINLESKSKDYAYEKIQKLCTKLPSDIDAQCADFIKMYGKSVLQMAINEFGNPNDLCSEAKIC